MGNYSRINIGEELKAVLSGYGIELTGKESEDDLKRMWSAFESMDDMDEFLKEAKKILDGNLR